MKNLLLTLAAISCLGFIPQARAQSTPPLATVISTCGTPPSTYTAGTNRPILQDTNGLQCTGATITPSGTQDTNLKQVNGATVNVGTGAAGTGTQRVTTSTDSTIGTVTTITNPVGVKGRDGSTIMGDSNPLNALCQDTNGTKCDFTLPTITIVSSQYPNGSTQINGNATGTTGAVVGTLAGTSGKTTYICGFNISATGGVATLGPIVVAGIKTASQTYQLFSTATGAQLSQSFSPCLPASATNTPITITTTADATASAVDVNSWGFQL